jgi:hypothetical protein
MERNVDRRLRRPPERYRSLASFYNADPRRIHSRELDIGLWWRERADGPPHRAAWVSDTGELYLVRLGPTAEGGGAVELLATVTDRERLESVLAGWREHCGDPRSLTWLRERAARLGERARVTQARMAATVAGAGAMIAAATTMALELG